MNNLQLTINISRTSVQITEVLRSSQEVQSKYFMRFNGSNLLGYKEQLKTFFEDLPLKEEYDEYTMAWTSEYYSLVPMRVFNDSSPSKIMALLFGDTVEKENSDFNRLAELNMVNVYEIPDWVKSFFIIKYPQLIFKHEHAITLRALFQGSTYNLKTIISVCDDYINIAILHKNELQFSNAYEFQNEEDIVYHLLFVLEQKGYKKEEGEIEFYAQHDENAELVKKAVDLLNDAKLIKSHKILENKNSAKLQLLCV